MKLIQELLVLSESSGAHVDLTPDQNRALENEIGDHFGFDVEVDSVTDLGDNVYKAFVSYDDPKTQKVRHQGVKFKGSFKNHSVEDFRITEGRDPEKTLWTILFHPEDGVKNAKPYPKAQVDKLVKHLSKNGVVTVLQNNAKDLKLHVAFNDSRTEDSVWDLIQAADLDDSISWGGSIRPAKKLNMPSKFNEGIDKPNFANPFVERMTNRILNAFTKDLATPKDTLKIASILLDVYSEGYKEGYNQAPKAK